MYVTCRSERKCQAFDIQRMREQRCIYYYIQASTSKALVETADSELYTHYQLFSVRPNPSIGLIETQIWQLIFSGMSIPHSIFPRAVFHLHHFLLCVHTHIIHIPKWISTLFFR